MPVPVHYVKLLFYWSVRNCSTASQYFSTYIVVFVYKYMWVNIVIKFTNNYNSCSITQVLYTFLLRPELIVVNL